MPKAKSALDFMKVWVGEKETSGKNRSPLIDALNHWMGVPLGSPYCSTAICRAFFLAKKYGATGAKFPKTASSQALKRHFAQQDDDGELVSTNPQHLLGWEGAIGGWTNVDDPAHGHVFLVAKRLTTNGKVVAIETIEANSNSAGSRDGEGFVINKRKVPIDRGHELWFCRTDAYAGGSFWK